jgi:hypothetical protein
MCFIGAVFNRESDGLKEREGAEYAWLWVIEKPPRVRRGLGVDQSMGNLLVIVMPFGCDDINGYGAVNNLIYDTMFMTEVS